MTNILYSFRRCPYAMRARMALKYCGIKVKIHEVSLKDKPESMLKISPKGQVPVLVTSDKKVIDESMEIISFALSVSDPDGWLSPDEKTHQIMEELIYINDTSFKENLDKYKYFDKNQEISVEKCRAHGEEFLKILESRLRKNKYLFGDKIHYGDIAIFPFIRQFAHVDKIWFYQSPYQGLQQWLNDFLESKSFREIMIKDLENL